MIENIIRWSIHNRFLVLLLTLFIILSGIYAIKNTSVDAIPDLSDVQVIIRTTYPGQAPQIVEDQVTFPLTTAMLAVPEAVTVRGESSFGDSFVYIIFKDGTDPYWARSRVLEYLSRIERRLPEGARASLGPDATGVGWVYEYALIDRSGRHDLSQLRSIQDWFLKYELQKLPGVAEVATIAGMVRQYQITLDPNRLRAFGLTLAQVKQAISRSNQEVGGSTIEMGEAEYVIRTNGYLQSLEDIKQIPLIVSDKGVPVLLKEVANVHLGPQSRRGVAELNGEGEVVGGIIVMRYGQNAMQTIKNVKARLNELKSSLPAGVEIVEAYDRSALIQRAIDTLRDKLIEEFIIVSLICMLFLFHLRSSLVVIISLPIGILIAFIVMYLQGINANIMSLGGIAIAIGVMVDAAIVMIENMHKHLEHADSQTKNIWEITQQAAIEVGPALFFSLLIVAISFLPIFALQAQEGRLFIPLAYTKTYAMAGAAGLSITLVPVLMGYLIRGKIKLEKQNKINNFLLTSYRPVLEFVLKQPKMIISIAIVLVFIGFFPLLFLGTEFMPDMDEGDLLYMPTTLPGLSVGKAQQLLQQTDKLIRTVPEVKTVFGKIGRAETATDPAPLSMIETIIQFKPKKEWRSGMTMERIQSELEERLKLPGISNAWVMPIRTRIDMLSTGMKTPVGIKIRGNDLKIIQSMGEKIEHVLKPVPGTASVYAERVVNGRYIKININRLLVARYGLNVADIQEIIETAVGGQEVTQTIEGRERYPVNLRYPRSTRDSLEALKFLPIVTTLGAVIPLNEIAEIKIEEGPDTIRSENGRLNGWVYIDIADRDLGSYVKDAKQAVSNAIKLPAGYSLTWSGQYEYYERATERLTLIAPMTIGLIILLLYLYFRRMTEVLLILSTIPFALIGAICLIYLLGYHLSVAVGVGLIALAGIAIELMVVKLTYLDLALNKRQKIVIQSQQQLTLEDIRAAIVEGALLRLRPITMTALAIIGALLPIMLLDGTGSEIMRRIAAPMIGGILSTTILALLVLPAVYFIWKQHTLLKREL